jgi:hypothetical protein
VPKIDWFSDNGDDQPRWEPRYRLGRERRRLLPQARDRRTQLDTSMALVLPPLPAPAERRPLHQIWGEPQRPQRP